MLATQRGDLAGSPRVSVIVPHYQDLERLDLCLAALAAQTYDPALTEIIVADNASPAGAVAVECAIAGRARLVIVPEKGAGAARNGGVAVASGEVLAFTDADCVPEPGWLAAGVAALPQAPLIGGAMRVLVANEARLTGAEAFERVFAFDNRRYVEHLGFTVTANLFCAADTFAAVGPFKVGVSEDLEWCRRAGGLGFPIAYAEAAVVGHPARRTWPELVAKWRRINRETYGLSAGRPGAKRRWLAQSLLLPVSALVHTPKVLLSDRLGGLRDRLSALATLYRLRLWRLADALSILRSEPGH